ncbi:MAG: helix-turn-helix transcriptional regulator [Actinophytocola sp.]|uniref:helix-turn-helix domain-containing protein n=1 Tax=Actinophytocola sp. TaxID=1872138 RepID=UPI003C764691
MAGKDATTRDRQVGLRLRALRETRGVTQEALAVVVGLSPSMLQRMETGKRRIEPETVATITTYLQVPANERQELIDVLKAGDKGGWWEHPLPGVPEEMGLLASYAADADSLTDWSLLLVPGLLQIEPYARAMWIANGVPAEEADLRWVARKRRQEILGTIDYTAFIYEGALHVPFGGPEVHRQQITHLMTARDRGISVRIVRERQPIGVLLHSWLYMTFPSVDPVVNVEVYGGGFYLEEDRVEPYTRRVEMLHDLALSSSESRSMLQALLKE